MANEPAVMIGLVTAIVSAALAALVAFGITVTQAQAAALVGLVAAVGSLVQAIWTRGKVTPR